MSLDAMQKFVCELKIEKGTFFLCVQNSWKKTLPHLLRDFSNHKHPKEFKLCMNEVASKDNLNGI
jgi:hypothetical protein